MKIDCRFLIVLLVAVLLPSALFPQSDFCDAQRATLIKSEPALDEAEILSVIKRWQNDIFSGSVQATLAYQAAVMMDPAVDAVADTLRATMAAAGASLHECLTALNQWTFSHMGHTQFDPQFSGLPGKDPWGVMDDLPFPTFKKLLPAEMAAMEKLTGRISGKCMTLAHSMAAVFLRLGVSPDDVLFLHILLGDVRHGVALVKFEGALLLVNNFSVIPYRFPQKKGSDSVPVIAVYTLKDFRSVDFSITAHSFTAADFSGEGALVPAFLDKLALRPLFPRYGRRQPVDFSNPEAIKAQIFSPSTDPVTALTRYASQSLLVKHPEYYLTASLRQSGPRALADSLQSREDVLAWVAEQIVPGSIFPDSRSQLMTADQVLLFRQGSPWDRAVLAYTLLTHIGETPQCLLSEKHGFIQLGKRYYDVVTGEPTPCPKGKIRLNLRHHEAFPGLNARRLEANRLLQQRQYQEALDGFEANAKSYKRSWIAQAELAECYLMRREGGRALAGFKKMLRYNAADDAGRFYRTAMAALLAGKGKEAVAFANQAVAIEPGYLPMMLNRICVLAAAGRLAEAEAAYRSSAAYALPGGTAGDYIVAEIKRLKGVGIDTPHLKIFCQFIQTCKESQP